MFNIKLVQGISIDCKYNLSIGNYQSNVIPQIKSHIIFKNEYYKVNYFVEDCNTNQLTAYVQRENFSINT